MEVSGPPFSFVIEEALPLDGEFSAPLKWSHLKDRVSYAASMAHSSDDECSRLLKKCAFLKKVCTK